MTINDNLNSRTLTKRQLSQYLALTLGLVTSRLLKRFPPAPNTNLELRMSYLDDTVLLTRNGPDRQTDKIGRLKIPNCETEEHLTEMLFARKLQNLY